MYILYISIALFASVLLVLVVLAQNSKGGGLTNMAGGSAASNIIGVKKTGDLLERLTWGLAITVMIFTLATNFSTPSPSNQSDELLDRARGQEGLPTAPPPTIKATPEVKDTTKP